jgi:hypothetical protein
MAGKKSRRPRGAARAPAAPPIGRPDDPDASGLRSSAFLEAAPDAMVIVGDDWWRTIPATRS